MLAAAARGTGLAALASTLVALLIVAAARTAAAYGGEVAARGHFLDVVEGLPTLKVFGRSKPQAEIIARVAGAHRTATMSTLRVAFLSALVLELAASVATALVAVEVGLRLLYGHLGAQFHASVEGATAAGRVFEILEVPAPGGPAVRRGLRRPVTADLRKETISLNAVILAYPGTVGRPSTGCT